MEKKLFEGQKKEAQAQGTTNKLIVQASGTFIPPPPTSDKKEDK